MTQTHGTASDDRKTVNELIRGQRTAMLTTIHEDGRLVTRPMACQEAEFDGQFWFFAEADSDKCREIRADSRVNVSFPESGSWVSISGTASVIQDSAKARELWNDLAEAWFQSDPDDPKVVLIRVDAETAEFWDSPGKAGQVLEMAKAKVSGERPDLGESDTVRL